MDTAENVRRQLADERLKFVRLLQEYNAMRGMRDGVDREVADMQKRLNSPYQGKPQNAYAASELIRLARIKTALASEILMLGRKLAAKQDIIWELLYQLGCKIHDEINGRTDADNSEL